MDERIVESRNKLSPNRQLLEIVGAHLKSTARVHNRFLVSLCSKQPAAYKARVHNFKNGARDIGSAFRAFAPARASTWRVIVRHWRAHNRISPI